MVKFFRFVCIALISAGILQACKSKTPSVTDKALSGDTLNASFIDFYETFHTDSVFQLEHITFPLMGIPSMADTLSDRETFRWKKQNWIMHQPFSDSDHLFQRKMIAIDEMTVIEYIDLQAGGLRMERRFAKLEDTWYLIYYGALNPVTVDN